MIKRITLGLWLGILVGILTGQPAAAGRLRSLGLDQGEAAERIRQKQYQRRYSGYGRYRNSSDYQRGYRHNSYRQNNGVNIRN